MTTAALSQAHFRGRSDTDVVNNTATWIANQDTGWAQYPDTPFRVRFAIQETAGGNPSSHTVKLQYQRNGGSFNDVTTSSFNVLAVSSASASADEAAITVSRLTGTGTFANGVYDETGATSTSVDMAANGRTEYEFGVFIDSSGVSPGDTIVLKVVALSGTAITISQQPTITVKWALQPSLFTNSTTFHAPTAVSDQTLTPSLYSNPDTFFTPKVSHRLTAALHTDSDTFYSPTVSGVGITAGEYTITIRAFDGVHYRTKTLTITVSAAEITGTPIGGLLLTLTHTIAGGGGNQNLEPPLFSDSDTFYSAVVAHVGVGEPLGLLLTLTKAN